ncbi:Dipeptidyl-peptidase 5 [Ophidiomyces ophidiicola]|uniref:Dipeptidyl-peptidase 5 n=1 Tax=Ophidiomyces ophidiicola TaxID=1387563 RepID=A0ACB8V2Q8_9EURO|nr:Dipeptidyl-peptidase 5 [Ophidiomyces ophidiicola]KAI1915645.1 Dipeptidyl-peptidase 5 [Ophidiomyces ophidiicola]KAI1921315.1 Dipeptidyl-peptidase 5 [Ophidiomyces ophidiicola]KAI1945468.1 Dipeptidyl-peptidase 5 [Ophidiomyces ophidiicola]KAI1950258.1 Dipeptidyl-peptidase 5 [Ophidiomyces ophidiicola]KAI1972924.1 Dipeptidyl-peptidase 5 [Ophidiomyces ophidiicola]
MAKWLVAAAALASPALSMTPEEFISAPRRGEAVPDPEGNVAFFRTSQYSFKTHSSSRNEWSLLDLRSSKISPLTQDSSVSEIVWLGKGTEVAYINSTSPGTPGGVDLWISDTKSFSSGYKAASFPGPLSGLKVVLTKNGDVKFVSYGQSSADGKLFNPEAVKKPLSSARIYDSIWVRHWDYYLTPEFNAVFSGTLSKANGGKYSFNGKLNNLVSPIKGAESPYPPFGGTDHYDISPDGQTVCFMSKAPELPKSNLTTTYIFVGPQDGSATFAPINKRGTGATPRNARGASTAPKFSPDSKQIAYLQMNGENYESDRNIIYISTLGSSPTIRAVADDWDRSPSSVAWTDDGDTLYVTAEDRGTVRLFSVPAKAGKGARPRRILNVGSVSSFNFLGKSNRVLVFANSLWSNALYYIANPYGPPQKLFFANEHEPELKGLGPEDIDEFYVQGQKHPVQSWIIKPENFDKNKKYPLAFLIHGGPQGSWGDSWSTRWCPKVWADQGYVVVTPNPTGSTGWGQEFTDAIQNDWGGAPYNDLVKVWEHIDKNIPYIDTKNGIAAGASYGGFMINWIQGKEFGRKFKALITHDGTFVAPAKIATDELFFMEHDFNGTFWDARDNYERFDPSAPDNIRQFATPHLVIHNDLDFRLSVADGLSIFNVLQGRGVPSRFLNFPDENHWVLKRENSLVWHQQVLGWANKYSGIAQSNPNAVKLTDTVVPVVNINPQ